MSTKKVGIRFFLIFIILISSCKKEQSKQEEYLKKYDTKEVLGFWKLIPSERMTFILFEEDGNAKIFQDNLPEEIIILTDNNGLRFFKTRNEETPFAYFLFSEKKETIWTGMYKDSLVRMERVVEKKKSVLE
jgi:hypothetical protein